jgi:predicted MFS family arabinose efflux permease
MNTTSTPTPIAELAEVTRFSKAAPRFRFAPLYWLALGTFAVGTEAFMIAAILPRIATDLVVSLQTTAQLVTIFALTYAISSPVLTALFGSFKRQKLLILAMAAFAGANLFAATASTFSSLAIARFLLALCAGLYTPNATALAGVLVPPESESERSRLSQVEPVLPLHLAVLSVRLSAPDLAGG